MKALIVFSLLVLPFIWNTPAQVEQAKPQKITLCELRKDPAAFNHKLIEVSGFITHGFENFTIVDPTCPEWPQVWLEYGGKVASGTMYCCGLTNARSRPAPLVVEKITNTIVTDVLFQEFDKLVQRRPNSVTHATIAGRFFSGRQVKYPKGTYWGGYGHMGCCSLLVIQQVVSVDPATSTELDYRSAAEQPDMDKTGCGSFTFLTGLDLTKDMLEAQAKADRGEQEWAFTDPKRVAADGQARLLKVDEKTIELMQTSQSQGRFIYEWWPSNKNASYMVVVSRPYMLSFYAKDPNRVVWTMLAAYESPCGKPKVRRRIRR